MVVFNKKSKFIGSLLGTAIGDAFGLPFEFQDNVSFDSVVTRAEQKQFWGYSDDTEMMIGIAESLLSNQELDPDFTLRCLAKNYEPARGYGKGMKLVFRHIANGGAWHQAAYVAWENGSQGNGSSVRVAPVACLYHSNFEKLQKKLQLSSNLTHADPLAVTGSIIQGLAIAYLICLPEAQELNPVNFFSFLLNHKNIKSTEYVEKINFISESINKNYSIKQTVSRIGNGMLAIESVPCGLYAFIKGKDSFRNAVSCAVQLGGDTDSIASLSGSLSGAYLGVDAIPIQWIENLEQRGKGCLYIQKLGKELYDVWETQQHFIA